MRKYASGKRQEDAFSFSEGGGGHGDFPLDYSGSVSAREEC